jgi:hypothetical protein
MECDRHTLIHGIDWRHQKIERTDTLGQRINSAGLIYV